MYRWMRRWCFKLLHAIILMLLLFAIQHMTQHSTGKKSLAKSVTGISSEHKTVLKKKLGLTYSAPFSPKTKSHSFNVTSHLLEELHYPMAQSDLINLTGDSVKDFVVVTAADELFYWGVYSAILTVQEHLPQHRIIVFDLGFAEEQQKELSAACKVEVRLFDFNRYPSHVKNKVTYAWKPIIIHEILREYTGLLWIDSSLRVHSSNFSGIFHQAVHKTRGVVMLSSTGHSNYAVTHPQMYRYLPSKIDALKLTQQWESGSMLLYRTHHIYNNVIKWWFLCALDQHCIAPTLSRLCTFKGDSYNTYVYCHRFDQSAINILLANLFDFNNWSYYAKDRVVTVVRGANRLIRKKLDSCNAFKSHN